MQTAMCGRATIKLNRSAGKPAQTMHSIDNSSSIAKTTALTRLYANGATELSMASVRCAFSDTHMDAPDVRPERCIMHVRWCVRKKAVGCVA